ncbi:hypothetical protein GGX14DRAFT_402636 [Mycena pura]|uniref:Chitin-binding type-4 domain-containing protein n=1 Tax=Mycena pura TaxID=153505 RepID=A0AAD6V1N3_9AGAR|nr:hypothetical protein GGX14DRAFT_402636 [Mycena pura]
MHLSAITILSLSAFAFRLPLASAASLSRLTSFQTLESHKCTGYCGGPTCGDVCSCSRFNFCFKGPSHGPDLYRIYNQPAGQAAVQGETVALSNAPPAEDGPQVEVLSFIQHLEWRRADEFSVEAGISRRRAVPHKCGSLTIVQIQLADSEATTYDLFWTVPDVGNEACSPRCSPAASDCH